MSHIMRKPVLAICEQQRCRSACASAQSDQHLCCLHFVSIIPLVTISKISRLKLISVAEQASLSLTWSQIRRGFLVTRLIYYRLIYYNLNVTVLKYNIMEKPTYIEPTCMQSYVSRLMTKPTKWLCAQRRLRSVWASTQSDQSLCCVLNG